MNSSRLGSGQNTWHRALLGTGWVAIAASLLAPPACQAQWQWSDEAAAGPSPRAEFGFAFDVARNEAVLLGGSNNLSFTGVNQQTWTWDGSSWSLESQAGPVARCDNAMAYDSQRNVVVSFGGYNGAYLDDTWEWDGTNWTQRMVAGPAARADSFMAYDSARGVMVLFGGQGSGGGILGDTWEWDGNTWTQRTPTTSPPVRWIHRMAYDSGRGVVVLFGGAGPVLPRSDTWEYDGNNWVQKSPMANPGARYGNGLAYDSTRGLVILFGGQSGSAFGVNPLGDTWAWDGTNWTQLASSGPPARTFTKIVYDSASDRTVMFGGYDGSQFVNDTWELTGPAPIPAVSTWGLVIVALATLIAGAWIMARRRTSVAIANTR